ncbi:MAG TPA: tRNA (N6-isopentenyl adenosine(37)-C2)-methylthiotransferase MiaB, partial [Terriglobales bacterium]|nr:tRNA (N6-isopentenyl adenosine(37)-C2)-methylthiotransferase MiaB [Terriglobales bacterium]
YLETFGCQMNVHDSERVAGTLVAHGYAAVETMQEAGLILFNTCSIRDKAAQKVFDRLANTKALAKQGKQFGVLGCVAQAEGEAIFQRAPHVSLVAGSASYPKLPELIAQLEAGERRVSGLGEAADEAFETELTRRDHPFRAFVTMIEGCDKHCAYCVVPYTRGKERSRTSAGILREVAQLVELGYTEVQLLGQNVNSYHDPSPAGFDFAVLLAAVGEVPGLRRVRYTTSHPRDFTPSIVEAMGRNPVLCDHVHLPVQSGSNAVLRQMRRGYTRERYLEIIAAIRRCARPLAVTTDIIVGFPGETDADLEQTLELMREVRYSGAFIFKYSPRPHTEAQAWEDSIPDAVKTERLMVLQRRQQELQLAENQAFVGQTIEIMVEAFHPKLGQWAGRSSSNRVVNFVAAGAAPSASVPAGLNILGQAPPPPPSGTLAPGAYCQVLIEKAGPNSFVGRQA